MADVSAQIPESVGEMMKVIEGKDKIIEAHEKEIQAQARRIKELEALASKQ